MASSLTLKIGNFTAALTAGATDAQVTELLKNFAWATGAPLTASDAELGQHVLAQWAQYAERIGRQYKQAEAAKAAAIETIGF